MSEHPEDDYDLYGKDAEGGHVCPYKVELNGDYSRCKCDAEETNQCRQDI